MLIGGAARFLTVTSIRRNKGKRAVYFLAYTSACVLLAIVQLFLGTNISIIIMAFLSLLLAGVPLFRFGLFDIASLFATGLLSKYSILPFFIKTFMGERLDVGLLAVDKTFPVILVGSFITVAALFMAKSIHIRKRLLNIDLSNKQLSTLGCLSFFFGFGLTMLHVLFAPVTVAGETSSGFGGFGGFTGLLYLGIICTSAHLARCHSRKIIDSRIILMLATSLFLSFASNAKLYFTLSLLAYMTTLFLFGRKVSLRYIVGAVFLALVYTGAVVPIVQVLRTDAFREATLQQRIGMVSDFVTNHVFGAHDAASASAVLFNYEYYPKLHTPIIDRLEMIQDLDLVMDGIDKSNTILWKPIPMALVQITPQILVPNKIPTIDVDLIAYKIGYIPTLLPRRRTMGIFGVSYAMFMWPGWMIVSFVLIFTFLLLIRKLVPYTAVRNIFGIYLLVKYGNYFSEIGVENLIGVMLRSIPMDIVMFLVLVKLAKMMAKWRVQSPAYILFNAQV